MSNLLEPYNSPFSSDERKALIAQSLLKARRSEGLSQKEVAAAVGVTQATYSTYERGRTEPPAEILVRLSYLFKVPVDVIIQRDRLHRTSDDAQKQIDEVKQQIGELESQLTSNEGNNPVAMEFLQAISRLTDQIELVNSNLKAQEQLGILDQE